MAYATGYQLVAAVDPRDIADFCGDSTNPVDPATVATNPIVLAALEKATGMIRAAAMIANKYTEETLTRLANSNDPFIVDMTCMLAVGVLYARRSLTNQEPPYYVKRAEEWLAALRLGELIFNNEQTKTFGNVTVGSATVQELQNQNLVAAEGRFFPLSGYGS